MCLQKDIKLTFSERGPTMHVTWACYNFFHRKVNTNKLTKKINNFTKLV